MVSSRSGRTPTSAGEIKTKSITVYGKVHGNITVGERCELKSRCTLQGDSESSPPRDRGRGHLHRQVGSDQRQASRPSAPMAAARPAPRSFAAMIPRRAESGVGGSFLTNSRRVTFVAKSPAKVSVECPHCGFQQMEYAAARSTLCRQCGRHFVVAVKEPAEAKTEAQRRGELRRRIASPPLRRHLESAAHHLRRLLRLRGQAGAKLRRHLHDLPLLQRPHGPARLQDQRQLQPQHSHPWRSPHHRHRRPEQQQRRLPSGRSSMASCAAVCIASRRAEFRAPAKVQGKLTAPEVLIGKKANVQFFRQLHVGAIEIRGNMSGEIVAETVVTIRSTRLARRQRRRAFDQRRKRRHVQRRIGHRPADTRAGRADPRPRAGPAAAGESVRPPAASFRFAGHFLAVVDSAKRSRAVLTSGWAITSTSRA